MALGDRLKLLGLLFAPLALASCDAWPTTVVNHSAEAVSFRWRQKQHVEWSAWKSLPTGQPTTLARAHYVEDFTGIEVEADGRRYSPTEAQLTAFRHVCRRSVMDHLTTLGDCEISFDPPGMFSVRRVR